MTDSVRFVVSLITASAVVLSPLLTSATPGRDPASNTGYLSPALMGSLGSLPFVSMTPQNPQNNAASIQSITSGYFETSIADAPKVLAQAIQHQDASKPAPQLLVSTDRADLYQLAEEQMAEQGRKGVRLLADPTVDSMMTEPQPSNGGGPQPEKASWGRNYLNYVKHSVRSDRIGFLITNIVMGADVWKWIHAVNYSDMTRAGQIFITVAMAVTFSYRKGSWSELGATLNEIRTIPLLRKIGFSEMTVQRSKLLIQMMTDFAMVVSVQGVRMGVIAVGGIGDPGFSVQTAVFDSLVTLFLVSAAFSFNGFGWGNWIAKMRIAVADNPVAKFLAFRFHEARSLLSGLNITSAGLINTAEFGYSSWIWVLSHGTIGLAAFLGRDWTARTLAAMSRVIDPLIRRGQGLPISCGQVHALRF